MTSFSSLLKASTKRTAEKACQTRKSAFLRGERTWAYVTRIKRYFDKVSRALYAVPSCAEKVYEKIADGNTFAARIFLN